MTIPFYRDGFALPVTPPCWLCSVRKPNEPISIWGAAPS